MVVIDHLPLTPLQRWAINVFGRAAATCEHGRQWNCSACGFMEIDEKPHLEWRGPLPVMRGVATCR
jgi:hypothetical protein